MTQHRAGGKQQRGLFKSLKKIGLQVQCNRGHWRIYDADGNYLLSTSGSPRDPDGQVQAIRRDLRRYHGIEVP